MANKARSKSAEAQASIYKTSKREETNRRLRLERELKRNPNNSAQILAAIVNIGHRRSKPKSPFWNATRRAMAILFKEAKGKVHLDIFSNNEKAASSALLLAGPYSSCRTYPTMSEKDMFSLKTRARTTVGI